MALIERRKQMIKSMSQQNMLLIKKPKINFKEIMANCKKQKVQENLFISQFSKSATKKREELNQSLKRKLSILSTGGSKKPTSPDSSTQKHQGFNSTSIPGNNAKFPSIFQNPRSSVSSQGNIIDIQTERAKSVHFQQRQKNSAQSSVRIDLKSRDLSQMRETPKLQVIREGGTNSKLDRLSQKTVKVISPKQDLAKINRMMLQKRKPQAQPLKHGTLTLIKAPDLVHNSKSQRKGQYDTEHDVYLAGNKKAMPEQAKLKLKWKTIQYLLENKKPQIEMLTNNLKELINEVKEEKKRHLLGIEKKKMTDDRKKKLGKNILDIFSNIETKDCPKIEGVEGESTDKGLNREEFSKLLEMIGLGTDRNLIEKLFWIFDDDGNGEVDHKELAVGLEMLKENTFSDKLDRFFDICDEDNSGTIDKKEFYNLLKLSMINYEDRSSLRGLVQQIFSMVDKDGNGEITKQEMHQACQYNDSIKELIEKNVKILKEVDHWIESDLEKPFHTRITFTLGCTNSKSKGVFYPAINKLVAALEERETVIKNYEGIKEDNRKAMRKLKGKLQDEESEDEY